MSENGLFESEVCDDVRLRRIVFDGMLLEKKVLLMEPIVRCVFE